MSSTDRRTVQSVLPVIAICLFSTLSTASGQNQYLVGDWNGDGKDNIAVRIGNRIMMDTDGDGVPDRQQEFGDGGAEEEYFAGDWDNSGTDHLAVRRGSHFMMDLNFDQEVDLQMNLSEGHGAGWCMRPGSSPSRGQAFDAGRGTPDEYGKTTDYGLRTNKVRT